MGRYYKFKVEAKNSVGYSAISNQIIILTAQTPGTPAPPTTTLVGDTIVVSWAQPDDGGTSISARQCIIPNAVLN